MPIPILTETDKTNLLTFIWQILDVPEWDGSTIEDVAEQMRVFGFTDSEHDAWEECVDHVEGGHVEVHNGVRYSFCPTCGHEFSEAI